MAAGGAARRTARCVAAPSAAQLWRWAGHRVKDPLFARQPEAHFDTAAFVDAVHASSKILRVIFPVAQGMARMRHALRGTRMPSQLEGVQMLEHWNSAEDFLEGAEAVHWALLQALWAPPGSPLAAGLREATSPEVRAWLDAAHRAAAAPAATDGGTVGGAADGSGAASAATAAAATAAATAAEAPPRAAAEAGGGGGAGGGEATILAVHARFERVYGPESLEMIRSMDLGSLKTLRSDAQRLETFHHDTWRGSSLQLQVAAVSEAELPAAAPASAAMRVRRADRLHLSCQFNLREGIASGFRVDGIEELAEEARRGGFDDQGEEEEEE